MENIKLKKDLIEQLIEISKEAGEAILKVYNTNFDFQIKEDLSPLTKADTLSNNIICEKLKILTPDIPILSEENSDIPFSIRSLWKKYWLVDPLDGTKEFIKHNDEFTVNIALIENNRPIIGVIYIPVSNEIYWGSKDSGSFYLNNNISERIQVSKKTQSPIRIITSRSHKNRVLNYFLEQPEKYQIIYKGSSLKFCLIASGEAEIYPRYGPTSEWDTAAGEAIVRYAGGYVLNQEKKMMAYNSKESFLNPSFIASNNQNDIDILLDNLAAISD